MPRGTLNAASGLPAPAQKEPARPSLAYEQQKQQSREEKRAKNRQNQLEKQIAELETKMSEIEKQLASPTAETDIMELTRNYLELKRDLDAKMDEWANIA